MTGKHSHWIFHSPSLTITTVATPPPSNRDDDGHHCHNRYWEALERVLGENTAKFNQSLVNPGEMYGRLLLPHQSLNLLRK